MKRNQHAIAELVSAECSAVTNAITPALISPIGPASSEVFHRVVLELYTPVASHAGLGLMTRVIEALRGKVSVTDGV